MIRYLLSLALLSGLFLLSSCAPPDSTNELEIALQNAQKGLYGEALFRSELCLNSNPEDVHTLLLNSFCILETSKDNTQRAKALHNLDKVTRMVPKSFTAWYYYGWGLCENRQYSDALPALEKAFELMPKDSPYKGSLLMLLGRCCAHNNLQSKGLRYLQPLRVQVPYRQWPEVYNHLGFLALNRKDYIKAEGFFNQALALAPGNLEILQNIAVTRDLYLNHPSAAKKAYIQYLLALNNGGSQATRRKVQNRLRQLSTRP